MFEGVRGQRDILLVFSHSDTNIFRVDTNMALTDTKVRTLKSKDRPFKLGDGDTPSSEHVLNEIRVFSIEVIGGLDNRNPSFQRGHFIFAIFLFSVLVAINFGKPSLMHWGCSGGDGSVLGKLWGNQRGMDMHSNIIFRFPIAINQKAGVNSVADNPKQ